MIFDWEPKPMPQVSELMQRASAKTGFTIAQIKDLVDSDLETEYLLDYISAVMSKRMN